MLRRSPDRTAGFTLVELLIVLAIVAIIAAIAIPSVLEARKRANEAAAISTLKKCHSAHQRFIADASMGLTDGFDPGYDEFEADMSADGEAVRSGYRFTLDGGVSGGSGDDYDFFANADPVAPGKSGDRWFYIDGTGVIRYSTSGPAGATSPPVE